MNGCAPQADFDPAGATLTVNRWIIHEANECAAAVTRELEAYRFNDASSALYRFIWNVFCDWYLELAKPVLQGEDGAAKDETRATAAWALGRILKLLHPFMPFVTEALWAEFRSEKKSLITAEWPQFDESLVASEAASEMNWVIDLITEVRSVRQTVDLPAGEKFAMIHLADETQSAERLQTHREQIGRLARLSSLTSEASAPVGVALVSGGSTYVLDVADKVDLAAVKTRLAKEREKAEKEISVIDKKLGNPKFVDRAPEEVVEEQRERKAGYEEQLAKLSAALDRLADI